jgi:hypothetical protein
LKSANLDAEAVSWWETSTNLKHCKNISFLKWFMAYCF